MPEAKTKYVANRACRYKGVKFAIGQEIKQGPRDEAKGVIPYSDAEMQAWHDGGQVSTEAEYKAFVKANAPKKPAADD